MDVLELPRPVINFLRTMAKESCRYVLSWDIFGGPDSVTLTLTWKLIPDEQPLTVEELKMLSTPAQPSPTSQTVTQSLFNPTTTSRTPSTRPLQSPHIIGDSTHMFDRYVSDDQPVYSMSPHRTKKIIGGNEQQQQQIKRSSSPTYGFLSKNSSSRRSRKDELLPTTTTNAIRTVNACISTDTATNNNNNNNNNNNRPIFRALRGKSLETVPQRQKHNIVNDLGIEADIEKTIIPSPTSRTYPKIVPYETVTSRSLERNTSTFKDNNNSKEREIPIDRINRRKHNELATKLQLYNNTEQLQRTNLNKTNSAVVKCATISSLSSSSSSPPTETVVTLPPPPPASLAYRNRKPNSHNHSSSISSMTPITAPVAMGTSSLLDSPRTKCTNYQNYSSTVVSRTTPSENILYGSVHQQNKTPLTDSTETIDPWVKRFECSLEEEITDDRGIEGESIENSDKYGTVNSKVKFKNKPDYI
ncbi:unnamed protein product [Didymodactylos carnosus]|uniref:Uncharacterized protein n=1 Tax=Didymodactylos carnosus TaxID=1234261 RepID=A0A814HZN4_9BILA|nr:unnamed protein product [Didymodactylos carnosus]CAF1065899.1 unnamed protein product [Didymodactylos carnosus]CAF3788381.1 unnamed protein product [Didymodactylos carnosus]CAF3830942.1 unnamed protein product [Didymodactylos carnosus]